MVCISKNIFLFSLCVQISWLFNSVESELECLPNYYLFTELISVHLGYHL